MLFKSFLFRFDLVLFKYYFLLELFYFNCKLLYFRNKYSKDLVLEQKKGELELIRAKNMKIPYKIYCARIHAKNMKIS